MVDEEAWKRTDKVTNTNEARDANLPVADVSEVVHNGGEDRPEESKSHSHGNHETAWDTSVECSL